MAEAGRLGIRSQCRLTKHQILDSSTKTLVCHLVDWLIYPKNVLFVDYWFYRSIYTYFYFCDESYEVKGTFHFITVVFYAIEAALRTSNFSDVYKAKSMVENFEEIIANTFFPIIEASVNPSSNPNLHKFLNMVRVIAWSLSSPILDT